MRFVVWVPDRLAQMVREAANRAEMLPTEWIRGLLRETFEGDGDEDGEGPGAH